MRAQLLILGAILSAGLLTQPADARSRDRQDERQEQRRDDRREQRREEPRDDRREQRREEPRGDRRADAARRAQERNGGGRVLSVEPDDSGYRVKVLKDGEVRTHHVED